MIETEFWKRILTIFRIVDICFSLLFWMVVLLKRLNDCSIGKPAVFSDSPHAQVMGNLSPLFYGENMKFKCWKTSYCLLVVMVTENRKWNKAIIFPTKSCWIWDNNTEFLLLSQEVFRTWRQLLGYRRQNKPQLCHSQSLVPKATYYIYQNIWKLLWLLSHKIAWKCLASK